MSFLAMICTAFAAIGITKVWLVDFEFQALPGERSNPICMVAHELNSGRTVRWWEDDLRRAAGPPYDTDAKTLMVAFYGSAEIGCHLALGWPVPINVLDLYVEFRNHTNGLSTPCGAGLLGALTYYGLPALGAEEKESMRALAIRGGPWTAGERAALLAYCESDVIGLKELLPHMASSLDLPRALLRGRYMRAEARMVRTGVPIQVKDLDRLRLNWNAIKGHLIEAVDRDYGVFDGDRFKADRWGKWLERQGIPWPRLPSGALALDADTFRDMALSHPEINDMKELRVSLSQMRLHDLTVGRDGRNRCMLSAFRAKTGRNQPSTTEFIFGPSVWLRSLIQAARGHALAYIDWSQQEFGIAAALSGDPAMMSAYTSGDAYMMFAIQAGMAPPEATKKTHKAVRELFKYCALAVQYGGGVESLARQTGQSVAHARGLLDQHHQMYPRFWQWSDAALDYAMLTGTLPTVFGWEIHVGEGANPRSLRNFPMQANAAEMLRLACCFATEQGILVCAPVHDALLVEAPGKHIKKVVAATQKAMADASRIVLGGFELRSEAKIFKYPARFTDERGESMWRRVWKIIEEIERAEAATKTRVC